VRAPLDPGRVDRCRIWAACAYMCVRVCACVCVCLCATVKGFCLWQTHICNHLAGAGGDDKAARVEHGWGHVRAWRRLPAPTSRSGFQGRERRYFIKTNIHTHTHTHTHTPREDGKQVCGASVACDGHPARVWAAAVSPLRVCPCACACQTSASRKVQPPTPPPPHQPRAAAGTAVPIQGQKSTTRAPEGDGADVCGSHAAPACVHMGDA
jgi:hypothetical protein